MPVRFRVAEGLGRAGPQLAKSMLQLEAVLIIGAHSHIPPLQEFCLIACVAVLSDFFLELMLYVAVLSIDLRRIGLSDLNSMNMQGIGSGSTGHGNRHGGVAGADAGASGGNGGGNGGGGGGIMGSPGGGGSSSMMMVGGSSSSSTHSAGSLHSTGGGGGGGSSRLMSKSVSDAAAQHAAAVAAAQAESLLPPRYLPNGELDMPAAKYAWVATYTWMKKNRSPICSNLIPVMVTAAGIILTLLSESNPNTGKYSRPPPCSLTSLCIPCSRSRSNTFICQQ